jgi:ferric-dicitrate binding protein FerR (iron transport regulator)
MTDKDHEPNKRASKPTLTPIELDSGVRRDSKTQRRVVAAALVDARRQARWQHSRLIASIVALLLMVGAAALLFWQDNLQGARPLHAPPAIPQGPSARSGCALPTGHAAPSFKDLRDGRRELDLAEFGTLMADSSAALQLDASDPCELVIQLEHGSVAGDLHDLHPARLLVRTKDGDVIVTGTRFSVQSGERFEVVLETGAVDVLVGRAEALRVHAGERLRGAHAGAQAQASPLSHADHARLTRLLDPHDRAPEPGLPNGHASAPHG